MPTEKGTQPEEGDLGQPPRTPPDLNPEESFYYASYPNQLTYTDGDGKERKICVKGRYEEARQLYVEKDWDGLKNKFPEWTGSPEQHYKPEDFEKMPKDRAKV